MPSSANDASADEVDGVFVTFEPDELWHIDVLALQGTSAAPLVQNVELPAGDAVARLFVDDDLPASQV